jgi:hypothetical protein
MKEFVLTPEDTEIRFNLDYKANYLIIAASAKADTVTFERSGDSQGTTGNLKYDFGITYIDLINDNGISLSKERGTGDYSYVKYLGNSEFRLVGMHSNQYGIMGELNISKVDDSYEYIVKISTFAQNESFVQEYLFPTAVRIFAL